MLLKYSDVRVAKYSSSRVDATSCLLSEQTLGIISESYIPSSDTVTVLCRKQ